MSLKNIFLKNFLTYKIYIYYNLYIRNKVLIKRKSYSQWGEDMYIKKYFSDLKIGFYVDIGCFHPIMYSNTCLLYNQGWSGLNIDLNETSIDLFNIMRPKDFNICAALSNEVKEEDLYIDHSFSPANTISKSFYTKSNKKIAFKNLKNKKIETKTFNNVVQKIPNFPVIDFLNIDCEGYDYLILKDFNLNMYKPKLLCIETHEINDKEVENYKEIMKLINENNYHLYKRCGPSSIFYKK
jgi:hypothetical protein|tara:strand:- start:88 stop:804 length:717 start_codon:yes stop_codon:yes gene_type:complete